MIIITNKAGNIQLLAQEGLLEWLQARYPYSQYHLTKI